MTQRGELQKHVAEVLRQYLIANGLRQTRERFAILRAAYDIDGIFTVEDLKDAMQTLRFHVSAATIYQTTQLLVQANLLIRHPFSFSSVVFESISDSQPRSYQVCNSCHTITRIKSKKFASGLTTYQPRSFSISQRIAYIYGTCAKCRKKLKAMQSKDNPTE